MQVTRITAVFWDRHLKKAISAAFLILSASLYMIIL
jgi:hypothetical protein